MALNHIPKIEYGVSPTTITFDYPPRGFDTLGERYRPAQKVSVSKSGIEQTLSNHISKEFTVKFSMLSSTIYTALKTFLEDHAIEGNNFKYYPHATEAGYFTVTLTKSGRRQKFKRTTSSDKYRFNLKMRYVL